MENKSILILEFSILFFCIVTAIIKFKKKQSNFLFLYYSQKEDWQKSIKEVSIFDSFFRFRFYQANNILFGQNKQRRKLSALSSGTTVNL